ncbi:putative amidoligase enzyme-domain-containing protein [Pseudomassariella vexata]|uniref:Putative amidoligase enzyme-domain-containing protein n=1 Tax=Pseudomassariella vexata TaxID=1141098 RepID=A0A1Y2DVV9_9PEZI|nr:putative amidoligase enzyme-domain-containing protein [Pseudomassariella vexata]ORY63276.1 putative amidoligase enzyme-domain-containing protein [Pseudomassariella vexata]
MASQCAFQFGIEIELLIGSRSKNHKSWMSLAAEVSTKLAKAGIPNHVNESNDKSLENYQEWSIVQEVTVPTQAGKNLWGLELVSPILATDTAWVTHLSVVFKTLKSSFTLSASANTSTHIHLSTSPTLSATQLSAIAKSILYFEPALDALLPASRASSYWCQSNRANPVLKSLSMAQCFEYLDYCSDPIDVVRTMCLYPASSAYGRANGYTEDFIHGVYKWDFSNLAYEGSTGTLEFRQCPGSRSADEVRTWVELAVAFAAGAIDGAEMIDPNGTVVMEDLWWIVSGGCQSSGIGERRGIEALFAGRGGSGKKGARK